jgi:chemotaxis family two-component system response regulator Rcp1
MVEPFKPKATRQVEILVVAANPADTLLTVEAFKAAGLTSGLRCIPSAEALKYIRRRGRYSNAPIPDLVFLDLSLPSVSGLKVLEAIKATPELMHIPIVVAAGSGNPKFIRAVYELNGNCFIRKPSEMAQFLRFIETCYQFWGTVVTLFPKRQVRDVGGSRKTLQHSARGSTARRSR